MTPQQKTACFAPLSWQQPCGMKQDPWHQCECRGAAGDLVEVLLLPFVSVSIKVVCAAALSVLLLKLL